MRSGPFDTPFFFVLYLLKNIEFACIHFFSIRLMTLFLCFFFSFNFDDCRFCSIFISILHLNRNVLGSAAVFLEIKLRHFMHLEWRRAVSLSRYDLCWPIQPVDCCHNNSIERNAKRFSSAQSADCTEKSMIDDPVFGNEANAKELDRILSFRLFRGSFATSWNQARGGLGREREREGEGEKGQEGRNTTVRAEFIVPAADAATCYLFFSIYFVVNIETFESYRTQLRPFSIVAGDDFSMEKFFFSFFRVHFSIFLIAHGTAVSITVLKWYFHLNISFYCEYSQ